MEAVKAETAITTARNRLISLVFFFVFITFLLLSAFYNIKKTKTPVQ